MNNFTPNAKYINHEVDIQKFKKVLTDLSIVLSYDLEACKDIINIKYGHLKGISYPIFKECLFAFLNKKLDILTSMFFAEQHSIPIDQLKRVAESDIPGDQPIPLNAQEEEMKRIKETLSLTDDVNLIILHRSIYVLKKKFEEFNKEIKEIYKEYNENDNEEEGVVVDTEKVEEIVKRIGRKCLFEVDKKEFKDAVVDELCYAGGDMFRNGEVMERLVEFVGRERRKYNKIFKVKKERKEVDLKEFEGYNGENEEDDMCKVVIEPIEEEVNEEEKEKEEEEVNEDNEDVKEGEGDEEKKEESNNEGEENEDKDEDKENVDKVNEDGKDDVDKSKSNENNESNNDEERKEGDDEKKSEKLENIEKNDGENEGNKEEEKKEDVKNENDDEQKEKDKNDNEEEEEEEDDEHEEKENEEKEKDENEIKNEEKEKSVINKEDSIDMKQSNDLKSNIDDKLSNIPNNDNISKSKSNLNNSHITNNNNNDNLSNSNQDALQPSTPPPEQSETKSLHSTKPPLQKEYKKFYLYIETLPLILADFLTSTPLSIILERNPSNLTNLRVLFDNEIMSRLGEETTYQIHLLKSERLKECLFSLSKIETNITHYNSILTQKQLQNENTTYITAMLNKLTSTKNFLTNTINTIQNDTNTYNEYQDKQGNYLQDQTTTELNQTKPSNAMMLINNTNNEIQQQLPSINDISNIDNNNQHQSNILNETVSIISNNNNNNNKVNNVQPPSSAVVRFQTSISSALSSARVNNNSKNYSHSRILLRQPLTKEQKRVNAIKEIFAFYARQHVNNNQIGTFDSLKLKLEHMNLSEFSKFCSEFQLLIPKDKRIEIFKKNISNTNTITINEFNNILPQLAKAIRDDKVNRLKKQILQNKLLLRHYKEQDDKKIIENISESIIVYKYANIDEQINKDKDEIKSLLKKDENILLEELYTYLEIDDEKKYRSKMKGFIAHSGKLILPKIQSENRIKNITERTKYEVKSMLTQHKLQMERDAEEKRKVEGMHKEYQKKQLEVFNRLYDKALKQRDKLERERKKVNEVKFIQPTNRVDNPFRRYYKAESVIHGMWKHAEHNKGFDDAYYNVVPQFKEEVKKDKKEDKGKERKVVRFVGEKVMEGGVKEKEMGKDVSIRDDEGNKDDMWGNNNNRKKSAFTWESLEKMSINEFKEREDIARLLGVNDL